MEQESEDDTVGRKAEVSRGEGGGSDGCEISNQADQRPIVSRLSRRFAGNTAAWGARAFIVNNGRFKRLLATAVWTITATVNTYVF
jgi:hypothetical protein